MGGTQSFDRVDSHVNIGNLNIETQRKDAGTAQSVSADSAAPTSQVVNFKISCAYTPEKAGGGSDGPNGASNVSSPNPTAPNANLPQVQNNAAQPNPANPNPPQVAKN